MPDYNVADNNIIKSYIDTIASRMLLLLHIKLGDYS